MAGQFGIHRVMSRYFQYLLRGAQYRSTVYIYILKPYVSK